MSLSPKAGGMVGVVLGVAAIAFTWYTLQRDGTFYGMVVAVGVGILPISLALAVLPTRMIMVPTEIEGRIDYNTQKPKWTTLGGSLLVIGILAGIGLYVYLRTGF